MTSSRATPRHFQPRSLASFVEQAVQLDAVPTEPNIDGGAKGRCGTSKPSDRHSLDESSFDPGDDGPRKFHSATDILLSELLLDPQGAELAAESDRIHRRIMAAVAYPAIDGLDRLRHSRPYPAGVILDFVLGIAALAAVWVSAKRWSVAYVARFGRRPPNGWMFSRVDDPALERGRRVLLVILALAALIAISILSRSYGAAP